jgi:hypothetical protein
MTSIGPQIPAHLLTQYRKQDDDNDNNDEGPRPPSPELPSYGVSSSTTESQFWVYDEDDGGSRELFKGEDRPSESHSTSGDSLGKRVLGPSIPLVYDSDGSDEDDIGPQPLQPGTQHKQPDAVKEFMEKEEKRRKAIEVIRIPA